MQSLRRVAVWAIACAVSSAAPSGATEPKALRPDPRGEVAARYFAAPPAQPPGAPDSDRTDPKWVESMQRVLKDLSNDNTRLRAENEQLRADNEKLKRQLAFEGRRGNPNRGNVIPPPEALRDPVGPGAGTNGAPPHWRPFEFNGATYYIIPLKDGENAVKGQGNLHITKPAVIRPEANK